MSRLCSSGVFRENLFPGEPLVRGQGSRSHSQAATAVSCPPRLSLSCREVPATQPHAQGPGHSVHQPLAHLQMGSSASPEQLLPAGHQHLGQETASVYLDLSHIWNVYALLSPTPRPGCPAATLTQIWALTGTSHCGSEPEAGLVTITPSRSSDTLGMWGWEGCEMKWKIPQNSATMNPHLPREAPRLHSSKDPLRTKGPEISNACRGPESTPANIPPAVLGYGCR